MKSKLYYEVHVTIYPPLISEVELLIKEAETYGFRMAKLFKVSDGTGHNKDAFFTTRGEEYSDVYSRMVVFIQRLGAMGFIVQRFKIEDTLLDSKFNLSIEKALEEL
jgi:hypothetical protein